MTGYEYAPRPTIVQNRQRYIKQLLQAHTTTTIPHMIRSSELNGLKKKFLEGLLSVGPQSACIRLEYCPTRVTHAHRWHTLTHAMRVAHAHTCHAYSTTACFKALGLGQERIRTGG